MSDKREPNMTDTPAYTPPEVWVWEKDDSPKWRYGNINRPIAGATHEKEFTYPPFDRFGRGGREEFPRFSRRTA